MKIATLDWDDNKERDLAGYKVYRDGVFLAAVPKEQSSYVDTHVPADAASVSYYVTAYNTRGQESEPSKTVTKFYDVPSLHHFTIAEQHDSVIVTWDPAVYPKVTAPRRTTKKLCTITISKAEG